MRFIRWDRRQQRRNTFRPMAEQLESRALLSIEPTLLATFSTADIDQPSIDHFQSARDLVFFNVNDRELWVTDGRPEGTYRIADEPMVGEPIDIEVLDGLTLFTTGTDLEQSGLAIRRYPGRNMEDCRGGFAQRGRNLFRVGQRLCTRASRRAGRGEIWRLSDDGSNAGRVVSLSSLEAPDIRPASEGRFYIIGDTLHLSRRNSDWDDSFAREHCRSNSRRGCRWYLHDRDNRGGFRGSSHCWRNG